MKKYVLHSGFHPEKPREYNGEPIQRVVAYRSRTEGTPIFGDHMAQDPDSLKNVFKPAGDIIPCDSFEPGQSSYYMISNKGWIADKGDEKYVTDWTDEERWCRVEEQEIDEDGNVISSKNIGFIIRRGDRSKGLL